MNNLPEGSFEKDLILYQLNLKENTNIWTLLILISILLEIFFPCLMWLSRAFKKNQNQKNS